MEVTGKVIAMPPMASGTGANGPWARQTVVIEFMEGEYTTRIAMDNSNKAEEFAKLHIGDTITAKCSVSSREYNGKWFTGVRCYSWTVIQSAAPQNSAATDLPL